MNKKTVIYVLFKEYPDPGGRGKSAPYVQDSADYLTDKDALMQDWTEVFDVLSYFSYELAHRYYDESNLEGMIGVAYLFPKDYPGAVNTIMAEMQSSGMTSWKSTPAPRTDVYQYGIYDVTNDLLGDMAQRENDHEPCVLLQRGAIVDYKGMIEVVSTGGPLYLRSIDNIAEMHQWLGDHRIPVRHYVFNAKHGDDGHPSQYYFDSSRKKIRAAQLLTGTTKTENLLKKAVGESPEGDLWYYDDMNGCYVYFENQGNTPQHEYHAYHLKRGDKNFGKINEDKLRKVQPHI